MENWRAARWIYVYKYKDFFEMSVHNKWATNCVNS